MLSKFKFWGIFSMLKTLVYIGINNNKRSTPKRLSKGLSIIEMLLGAAIGLFILTGASTMFVNNITNSRRILLETRINQDMRSTMDLVTRDLRRSGYWGNSLAGTLASGSTSITKVNPYSALASTESNKIIYNYSRDITENNVLDINSGSVSEQFGFRLDTVRHEIQMEIAGKWQTLTNNDIVLIPDNGFTITPINTAIDIRSACVKTCTDLLSMPTCPRVQVRTYQIVLTGISKTDAAVIRTLRSQVRVRNDVILGSCPA